MARFEEGKTYNGSSIDGKIPVSIKVSSIEKQSNPDPLINELFYLIVETEPPGLLKTREVLFIDVDKDGAESVGFIHAGNQFFISGNQ